MELNARDLDNWITGHYGEDQFRYDEVEQEFKREMEQVFEPLEDEDNTGEYD